MKEARTLKIIGIVIMIIAAVVVGILIFPRPVMAPEPENTPAPTETEEPIIEEAEPTSTVREAYVPDPEEMQEIPDVSTLKLTEDYIVPTEQEGLLKVSWPAVPETDYYVLCILDASKVILQTDILKAEITEWEFPDFRGASVMLLCYKDMGEDSTKDDMLIGTYIDNINPDAIPMPIDQKNKYKIIVDKEDHAFAAFTYDINGEYTIKVAEFPCALGRSSRMTPTGTFKISNKGRWKAWRGNEYSPFYTRYTSGLYFHGPIYRKKNGSTMITKSYDQIGTNASAGCVRTTTAGAYWVYTYCPAGTIVEIMKSSDLVSWPGKPEIDPNFPKWDPTDPEKPSAPEVTPAASAVATATASANP